MGGQAHPCVSSPASGIRTTSETEALLAALDYWRLISRFRHQDDQTFPLLSLWEKGVGG
jgi:hypothetical protein